MGLKVQLPNAFTINRLAFPGGSIPYPFGIANHEYTDGTNVLSLHPMRVLDISDSFDRFEAILVFEVSQSIDYSHTEGEGTLGRTASAANVDHDAIDDETIVVAGPDLLRLLSQLDHYNFHAFDIPRHYDLDLILNRLSACHAYGWSRTTPLLPHLSGSDFFLYSHDDCYLHLESHSSSLLRQVVGRAFQIYVGTLLIESSDFSGEIDRIPDEILHSLWPVNSGLTIFRAQTEIDGLRLRMGISQLEFDFGTRKEYPISLILEYDAFSGDWKLSN